MNQAQQDPQTQAQIEAFLCEKLASDEAETGLYRIGSGYVAVDRAGPDNKVTFQWFNESIDFSQLVNKTKTAGVIQ